MPVDDRAALEAFPPFHRIVHARAIVYAVNGLAIAINAIGVATNLALGAWPLVYAGTLAAGVSSLVIMITAWRDGRERLATSKLLTDVAGAQETIRMMQQQHELTLQLFAMKTHSHTAAEPRH